MFGSSNNNQQHQDADLASAGPSSKPATDDPATNPALPPPATPAPAPPVGPTNDQAAADLSALQALSMSTGSDSDSGISTELPPTRAATIDPPAPPPPLPDINTVDDTAQLQAAQKEHKTHAPQSVVAPSGNNDALMDIKQKALAELSPLVSHLDQSPEEKFKTLMMMIQANDNKDLIKEAYTAAEQITDEKAKSQALLDVVNEINYFTQKQDEPHKAA